MTAETVQTQTLANDLIPEPAIRHGRILTAWHRLAGPAHPTTLRGGLRLFAAGFVVLSPPTAVVSWTIGVWLAALGIRL